MRRRDAEDKHADQKIQAVGLPGIGGAVLRHGPYGQCRGLYKGAAGRVGDGPCGFGDIDGSGYLDRLYVHRRHQGKGVATALCDRLEQVCAGVISTHASITAKPFFEKRGYRVIREQQVERQGVALTNFVMEKRR